MKGKFRIELWIALIVALIFAASKAHDTTLEFGNLTNAGMSSIGSNTPPGYGDNVTSTSDTYGSYLEGTGFTPNITTNYSIGGIFGGNGKAL